MWVASLSLTVTDDEAHAFDELVFTQDDLRNDDGTYATSKTFAYEVREVPSAREGFSLAAPQVVSITVANDGTSELKVSYSYATGECEAKTHGGMRSNTGTHPAVGFRAR